MRTVPAPGTQGAMSPTAGGHMMGGSFARGQLLPPCRMPYRVLRRRAETPARQPPRIECTTIKPSEAGSAGACGIHFCGDEVMEASRKDMRSVFDPDRWVLHRSSSRYFRHMGSLLQSRFLLGLAKPLMYVVGLAVACCTYGTLQQAGLLPAAFPVMDIKCKEFFGHTSFALSLLLVFRTNASYGRWDEARKMWGMVLNRSRDIVRLGLTWIKKETKLRSMLCRWVPAFSKTLMCHLRKGEDLRAELEGILLPHEVEAVMAAKHRPNYVLQVLGEIVYAAQLPIAATLKMEESLTAFEDCLGGCERILRTPVPLTYSRHTSRFMMIWLSLLPFTLWPTCGWVTVPLSGVIAFLLLGIDKIGVSIEEPYSILALEAITGTVVENVRELASMHIPSATPVHVNGHHGHSSNGSSLLPVGAADIVARGRFEEQQLHQHQQPQQHAAFMQLA